MWLIYMLLSSFCIAAKAIPYPGHGALAGYCNTSDQCATDECCISFIQPRGKRTIVTADLSPELLKLVKGKCHKTAAKHETCFVPGGLQPPSPGLWYDCPCADSLYCEGTGMALFDKGEVGHCAPKTLARALRQPCASGADCPDDQCCVNNYQPGGKRQLGSHGHCFPMGDVGFYCYARSVSGKPLNMVFSCPCKAGLSCVGNGIVDAQFGENGKCA